MIETVFEGIETNDYYHGLKEYPKFILKLNSLIKEVGISKVINKYTSVINRDLFFEDLTMIIRAKLDHSEDSKKYSEAIRNYFHAGFENFNDYYYIPDLDYKEIKSKIKTEGNRTLEFVAGFYIPSRNLIYITIPLFDYAWANGIDKPLEVLEGIIESLKELKIIRVDISKEIEKSRIEAFMKVIRDNISITRSQIADNQYSLDDYNKKIVDLAKRINYDSKMIQSLMDLEKQDANLISDQIARIKKIPFVKEVELTNDGIAVYISEIALKYNKKDYAMGRFRIYIKPQEVQIYNFDAIKMEGTWYDHPHIKDAKPCLNTWGSKVSDLLSKIDFVNLIIFLKMYLQSYSEGEGGNPFVKMETWEGFRKKQILHLKDKIPGVGHEREYIELIRKEEIKDGDER